MNSLVIGVRGMVGTDFVHNFKNIRNDKKRTRPNTNIYEYDIENTAEQIDEYGCDFVFNLAGVSRPIDFADFQTRNFDFASQLMENQRNIIRRQLCCFLRFSQHGLVNMTAIMAEVKKME